MGYTIILTILPGRVDVQGLVNGEASGSPVALRRAGYGIGSLEGGVTGIGLPESRVTCSSGRYSPILQLATNDLDKLIGQYGDEEMAIDAFSGGEHRPQAEFRLQAAEYGFEIGQHVRSP